jgi:hypothetical protein
MGHCSKGDAIHQLSISLTYARVGRRREPKNARISSRAAIVFWQASTCSRIGFRCIQSHPEMQSIRENDIKCLGSSGVQKPVDLCGVTGVTEFGARLS